MNKNQGTLQGSRPTSVPTPANSFSNTNRTEPRAEPEETDEDPLLKEGYLPEIYFSLKSDNPADW